MPIDTSRTDTRQSDTPPTEAAPLRSRRSQTLARLGAHAREHHGTAVWWCNASGGHTIAPSGQWKERPDRRPPEPAQEPHPS